jgi:hypothetical protein
VNRKLFHAIWIGVVALLTLAGVVLGLRSFNVTVYDRRYVWSVEPGPEGEQDNLVRGVHIKSISGDISKLVFAFNKSFEDAEAANLQDNESRLELPRLQYGGTEGDTLQVDVANSGYLTQRMGTTGARQYLAAATFTLTETPGAMVVNFRFPEGDHAVPGRYQRGDFEDFRIVFVKKN